MKPTEPGFYWVQTEYPSSGNKGSWDAIAHVRGESPFLYVASLYYPWTAESHVRVYPDTFFVKVWGEKNQEDGG